MTRHTVTLYNAQQGHAELMRLWSWLKPNLIAGQRMTVEARTEKRSDAQNRLLWSIMGDISRQVQWMVDGKPVKLDLEEWKEVLSAGLRKTQRVAAGIEGGFVMLGQRTSKMGVREMGDLIELAYAFGAQHEPAVQWSRTSLSRDVPDECVA